MLVGWTLFVQLMLSGLLAVVVSDLPKAEAPIHHGDAWHALCERAAESAEYVRVSVHLKSGRDLLGTYVGASTDLEPAKRELIIGAPLAERKAGSEETVALDEAWQRMVISGAEVESVAMCYVGKSSADQSPNNSFTHRAGEWVRTHWQSWKVAAPAIVALLAITVLV
jgi:hypothetical protein